MSMQERIRVLAVGAAGESAGLVVPELAQRGAWVRGMIHDPSQAEAVRAAGASDIVVADLSDGKGLDQALQGIDVAFYIAPAFLAGEADAGVRFVDAARQAGVRRVVFSSVIDPTLSALQNHQAKGPVEEALFSSGLEFAILQPALFFQNLTGSWPTVVRDGVLAEPWSADTRFSRVDYRDVAEVAALALLEERLLWGTYQLCAEGHTNRNDLARIIQDVLGRTVRAERTPLPPAGPDDSAAAVRPMLDWYDHHGLMGNALTLRAILGREPRSLRAFVDELARREHESGPTRTAASDRQPNPKSTREQPS